jgi:hypothetical protein
VRNVVSARVRACRSYGPDLGHRYGRPLLEGPAVGNRVVPLVTRPPLPKHVEQAGASHSSPMTNHVSVKRGHSSSPATTPVRSRLRATRGSLARSVPRRRIGRAGVEPHARSGLCDRPVRRRRGARRRSALTNHRWYTTISAPAPRTRWVLRHPEIGQLIDPDRQSYGRFAVSRTEGVRP